MWHGDIRLGDTIDIKFCTVTTTGAPTTLAGTPVVSAYPGNSTTQLTAGITLTVDFDAVTGLHNVRVVATSGNGYATATNYTLVITTGTVGGTSVVGYCIGSFSIENRSAVMPTTAARTLDVSAGGEAGVDWANVGSPTTAVDLSGTTIKTTQKVDVDTIKTGAVAHGGGTVTFPGSSTIASTTNITAGTIATATNVTTVNGFAAGAITAAAIAADAIGASELAADAATEIAAAVWDKARASHVAAGSFGEGVASVQGNVTGSVASVTGAVGSVTGNVGGNVAGSVGSVTGAVGSVTGAVGSVSGNVGGNVVGSVGSVAAGGITASSIAADAIGASELAADAVAEIADAIWDEARAGHIAAGSFGEGVASVQGNVTGSVASVTGAVGSVSGAVGSVTGNVGGNVAGSVGSVTGNVGGNVAGSVGSVTAAVTAGTVTDKTGYAIGVGGIASSAFAAGAIDATAIAADAIGASELAAGAIDEIWDEQIGDSTITARQALKAFLAALAGKLSGAATATVTIRNVADDTNVIVATVDADGNRSAVTLTV